VVAVFRVDQINQLAGKPLGAAYRQDFGVRHGATFCSGLAPAVSA
jgi:hypothetical protein